MLVLPQDHVCPVLSCLGNLGQWVLQSSVSFRSEGMDNAIAVDESFLPQMVQNSWSKEKQHLIMIMVGYKEKQSLEPRSDETDHLPCFASG